MQSAIREDYFNQQVLRAAKRVSDDAIRDFLGAAGQQRATVVEAAAGAGKTGFITAAAGAVLDREMRPAVCTPTNEQAFALVARLARAHPNHDIAFLPASTVHLPPAVAQLPNVKEIKRATEAKNSSIVVGTMTKFADASCRGLDGFDVLMMDESFQADSARYFGVANLAPTHLLVGDSGQLSPFSTMPDPGRWRGLAEDPLQTAVGVLRRNHACTTAVFKMPITRRLDSRAVEVARAFYPGLEFDAAVRPGTRELGLFPASSSGPRIAILDRTLELAAQAGWAHIEFPAAPALSADPAILGFIRSLLERLFLRRPSVRCEVMPDFRPLAPQRVAVGVAHNDQKELLRSHLCQAGLPQVVVETANKLQGLEFDFVIAWHPLAGLPEVDEFHLDPGRLCVLLTRHRHACIVVGRAGDRNLVNAIPPSTPAYLDWDPDPVLDGWEVHRRVFAGLERYRLEA